MIVRLKMFFCDLRVLARKLAIPLATQGKSLRNFNLHPLGTTCWSVLPGLIYPRNALPTELLKPHESSRVWVQLFMFSGCDTQLKYMNSMVTDVQQ